MLELTNASVGYAKKAVLDAVSVSFEKGRLTSVIGANGAGKTTLLKALLGLLPLSKGSVSVDGVPLSSLKRQEIAQRIAYLPQGKSTPDMTVFQMVLHGRFPYLSYPRRYTQKDREIADACLARFGLRELADRPLHTLSGGMRQNAYLAMALAQDTDYILLDEPTTHLDIAHQLELVQILRALAREGKGVIAVMHDLPLSFDCSDEIVLLASRSAILTGTPQEMSARQELRESFGVRLCRIAGEERYYYKREE